MVGLERPPIREGNLTPNWIRWFQTLRDISNAKPDYAGPITITGEWRIPKMPSTTITGSTSLTSDHFGRVIKVDSADDVVVFLPSVGKSDIDSWLTIMRLGTGKVTVKAADLDTIEKSRPGGVIFCREVGRVVANLTFFLATETKWAIQHGTGIWIAV